MISNIMHHDNDLLDLRSLISFAEATELPVKATFSVGGSPITFSIQQDAVLEVKRIYSVAAEGENILTKYTYILQLVYTVCRYIVLATI